MRTLNHGEIGSVAGGLSVSDPGFPRLPLINDLFEKLRDAAAMRDAMRHLLDPSPDVTTEIGNGY